MYNKYLTSPFQDKKLPKITNARNYLIGENVHAKFTIASA